MHVHEKGEKMYTLKDIFNTNFRIVSYQGIDLHGRDLTM